MAITSLAAGIQAATWYFAYSFNYQELLGPNFNHIYAPWSYFKWYSAWHDRLPDAFLQLAVSGLRSLPVVWS
ncbi:hypothetical protein [Klebsiella quasipneumoniae]|uniref:hypothetical protein n=1 Tax=Klebsiella quasipneumoniae TaxID=1463165 RepID=UPI00389082FC